MHWIEDLFGINPDGGSGSLEIAIFLAVVLVALFVRRERRRVRRRP
jgi:MYXO-CTERM domain-containing protein